MSAATFAAAALDRLRTLTADPAAEFREDQLDAIGDLVADRARVLCVQRTGWGKSAVYFVATALLREGHAHAPAGPTLIVSPLLALMRNQIEAARRLGLRAHTINSTNRDEWDSVRERLAANTIDLLLISPERLNNPRFRDDMLPLFARSVGLLVIDEAHCISDWGHDFRPDYRRVKDMLDALGEDVAVLGTTATANDRVVGDVLEQLAVAGDPGALRSYRGPLARTSLRLETLELAAPAQRLAWLVEHLPRLPGSGIVYTLTKRDAEQVATFLTANGIAAEPYSGEQESEQRIATEGRLLRNELKAVVATSALGMGYDKADLTFVVHYQAPGSVVSYYQQVGRAGRGVDHADVVLLRGGEDRRIQDFFIEQAFPGEERVQAVLEALRAAPDGRTTRELMAVVNLGAGRIEAMLKILDVEGAVRRHGTRWQAVPDSDWAYDGERYAQVTALRRAEQEAMARFGTDGRCLMRTLQEELDDPGAHEICGRCSVCTAPRFADAPDPRLVELAQRHLRSRPLELEAKKMAPDAAGAMRKIPEDVRVEPGVALARFGDGGWWPAIQRGIRDGALPDDVIAALADAVRGTGVSVGWVTYVPSESAGRVIADAAARLAGALGVPAAELVERTGPRPAQREMANAAQQAANVRGAFRITASPPPGRGVLLDDRRNSGWTLAMVGGQLRRAGAEAVMPVAFGTLN